MPVAVEDLAAALVRHRPGDRVALTAHRGSQQLHLRITLTLTPQSP